MSVFFVIVTHNPLGGGMRPRFSASERADVLSRSDNPHGAKTCWHCGLPLIGDSFDVDHYPATLRDIEDQMCIGVTDPKDGRNLVPSCRNCNRSHRYEVVRWHGYSQWPCKRSPMVRACALSGWLSSVLMLVLYLIERRR